MRSDVNFYKSKFVLVFLILANVASLVCAIFFGRLVYDLGEGRNVGVVWFAFALVLACCIPLWWLSIRQLPRWNDPVISFQSNGVTYRLNSGAVVSTPFPEIRGVEVETAGPKAGGGHILIHKGGGDTDKVFLFNLAASREQVFSAFEEMLPNLVHPRGTLNRLVLVS